MYDSAVYDSAANKFVIGFGINDNSTVPSGLNLSIHVATNEDEPVEFAVFSAEFDTTGIVTSNVPTIINIPKSLLVGTHNTKENNGIYVKAEEDKKITIIIWKIF